MLILIWLEKWDTLCGDEETEVLYLYEVATTLYLLKLKELLQVSTKLMLTILN
jgi:hypothetical protein